MKFISQHVAVVGLDWPWQWSQSLRHLKECHTSEISSERLMFSYRIMTYLKLEEPIRIIESKSWLHPGPPENQTTSWECSGYPVPVSWLPSLCSHGLSNSLLAAAHSLLWAEEFEINRHWTYMLKSEFLAIISLRIMSSGLFPMWAHSQLFSCCSWDIQMHTVGGANTPDHVQYILMNNKSFFPLHCS